MSHLVKLLSPFWCKFACQLIVYNLSPFVTNLSPFCSLFGGAICGLFGGKICSQFGAKILSVIPSGQLGILGTKSRRHV